MPLVEVAMHREKIKNHVLAGVAGPSGSATVSRIALDTIVPPLPSVGQRFSFVNEIAQECGANVAEWEDGGYIFTVNRSGETLKIRDYLSRTDPQTARAIFDPGRLESGLRGKLPATLREMADAIERGDLFAEHAGFTPWGFHTNVHDHRAHFLLKLHIASEIRKAIETEE
jgi:hypothetical protein